MGFRISIVLILLFSGFKSWSASLLFFDTNLYYASDSLKTTATDSNSKMLYDICFGFGVSKNNKFQVGWNYTGHSFTDTVASVATTYTSTQMGPRFIYYFDKDRNWRSSLAYNLSTSATYTAGSNPAEKWKGTGISLDFGYQMKLSDSFAFGIRLSYTTSTFTESLVNNTTYSTISYNRSFMYPSVATTYEF
jgi:hypothetical protein